jgi:alpha-glucosidase
MRILLPSRMAILVLACAGSMQLGLAQTAFADTPASVEAKAINEHTFCLHVSFANIAAQKSLFINPNPGEKRIKVETVKDGTFSGVKTVGGQLLVDREKKQWMLKDSQGKVVIPATSLASLGGAGRDGRLQVIAPMGAPASQGAIYGSGDVNSGIQQSQGQGRVGNGTTGVPYYWTTTGYSVLALGESDDAPASWQRSAANGLITWTVPGNSIDLYLTPAATLEQATKDYAQLTGKPPVPPRWAMGYMQSRWGWQNKAYIDDTLQQFLNRKLPVDVFIFDFEWYTAQPDYRVSAAGSANYSDFSFNPELFPDPAKQIADLHAKGVYMVGIRKPRLSNAELLAQLREKGWVRSAGGTGAPAQGPGGGPGAGGGGATEQRLLDYSNPEVREWYAGQMAPLLKAGIDGWWNDEGEQTYTTYTNWILSEAQALAQADPTKRLWTINRAFAPGMQRHGASAWTGDFLNGWQGLPQVPTRLLNWSLAGMYYGACDIGGFGGNITPELLMRWMEAGVFFPVMRSHSANSVTPRFPWLYGEQAEAAIRKALELRYRLVPYYYSLAHEAAEKGTPLMRPLAMEFPDDPQVANLTNQWLMGKGLMAAPILTVSSGTGDEAKGTKRSVYFPKATWYALDTNKTRAGGAGADMVVAFDEIPVFVRAGTILPLGPVIQHTDDLPGGPLDLQVYPGANGTFTLAEDDGRTTAYKTGQARHVTFTWDDATRTLSWNVDGPYRGKDIFKEMKVTVFYPGGIVTRNVPLKASNKLRLIK